VPIEQSVCETNLPHVCLVIPEQMLLHHDSILPHTDCRHWHLERLARRWNELTISNGHRFGERAFKNSGDGRVFAGPKSNRMLFDSRVRRRQASRSDLEYADRSLE
jgi:hypothetical protein